MNFDQANMSVQHGEMFAGARQSSQLLLYCKFSTTQHNPLRNGVYTHPRSCSSGV